MRKTWNTVLAMWRPVVIAIAAIIVIGGLLLFRLNTLMPGLSQSEINTYLSSRSVSQIIDNSVNAPYRSAVFIATKVFDNIFGLRLVGALVGALSIVLFYFIARRLLRGWAALAATALFATSSLLLSMSRLASPHIMHLSLLAIIGVGYMIRFEKRQSLAWILASIVVGLSLYVPGMVVFIILAALFQFRRCRKSFESLSPVIIIIASVILSILAAPLVINLVRAPELWREYLGLPAQFANLASMGKEMLRAGASLFVISPKNPAYWLGRQPVLDIFASILFLIGVSSIIKKYRLDRAWALFGIFVIGLLWIGLSMNILYILVLLPFVYIVIGFGLQELLSQWQNVFPRNPIARTLGMTLVIAAVALSVNFQLQRYFVAWPNNIDTRQTFNLTYPAN